MVSCLEGLTLAPEPVIALLLFLQVCDGASAEERARWKLSPAREYHYLKQSTCFELAGVDNAKEFRVRVKGGPGMDCLKCFVEDGMKRRKKICPLMVEMKRR